MKKINYVFIILSLLFITSCSSITDLFSKNKDEKSSEVSAPQTVSDDILNDPITDNIPEIEKEVLPIDNSKKESSDKKTDTLEDLINTIPDIFQEPLVRDLDITETPEQENLDIENTEKNDIIENISESPDKSDENVPDFISSTETTNISEDKVEPKITVIKNDSSKETKSSQQVSSPSSVKESDSKPQNTQNKVENPVKDLTQSLETNKNSSDNKEKLPETENKSEITSKETDTNNTETQKVLNDKVLPVENDSNNLQNNETQNINTQKETIPNENKSDLQTVEKIEKEETKNPPVTSAGTKTENATPLIPSESVPKTLPVNNEIKKKEEIKPEPEYKEVKSEDNTTNTIEESQKNNKKPTRAVTLNKGETLIVEYPGSGWIYLGSEDEYNNLESKGRKSGTNTTYTLTAINSGTQIQHFYKTDSLSGKYIDDYIEVTVTDKKGLPSTIVYAPKYEEIVPKKAETPALASDKLTKPDITIPVEASKEEIETVIKTGERSSIEYTPEDPNYTNKTEYNEKYDEPKTTTINENTPNVSDLYEQALKLYEEKQLSEALKVINTYLEYAVSSRDKGLFLKAKILEADGSTKNIKEAIKTYQSLQDNYPASEYWEDSNKRVIYLKRFYLEAR